MKVLKRKKNKDFAHTQQVKSKKVEGAAKHKYSSSQYFKLAFKSFNAGYLVFKRDHKLAHRLMAIGLVLLLIFTIFISVYEPFDRDSRYNIGHLDALIDRPIALYGEKLVVDQNTGNIKFNEGYQPSSSSISAGLNYSPKITASFEGGTKPFISVNDPLYQVSTKLKPLFKVEEPRKNQNRVIYPIVKGDAVKVYTLKGSGVKEDIVLNTKPSNDEMIFDYELELSDGTEARLEKDGSIGIYGVSDYLLGNVTAGSEDDQKLLDAARKNGEKNKLLFKIPKPVILEQHKKPSVATAYYELENNVLKIVSKGLSEANYPLSIDPSIYVETARKLMRGNNESNVDFDVDNELIQKSQTTGARIDEWTNTTDLTSAFWDNSIAANNGFVYNAGGVSSTVTTVEFTTQGADTYVIPGGVTSITVKAWGGGGGGGSGGSSGAGGDGGAGGFAQATLSVTPAETLNIYVGEGGGNAGTAGNAGDGGGGGGHSEVNRSGTNLIIAGGGGGGGGGDNSSSTSGGAGGGGGGTTGQAGDASSDANGGTGGTSGSGGSGGSGGENTGSSGGSESGGNGGNGGSGGNGTGSESNGGAADNGHGGSAANNYGAGGGGGGGYYGGGGGSSALASDAGGGGGGGGSSYGTGSGISLIAAVGTTPGSSSDGNRGTAGDAGSGGATSSAGTAGSDGKIVITYSTGTTYNSSLEWAEFNNSTKTIDSPNPGAGACSGWCSESDYDLPDERVGMSMVAYNGYLYAMGGENDSGTRQSTVYIAKLGVNGEPQLWHPTDTNPDNWVFWYSDTGLNGGTAKSYFSAVAYNNRMYIVGGQTNASTTGVNAVEVADILPNGRLGSWTADSETIPSAAGYYQLSVKSYNGHLYILGGFNGANTSSANLRSTVYHTKLNSDGSLNAWQATDSFSTARSSFGGDFATIWGAYLYIGGGCSAVNGSGYCTTIQDDAQLASINADGSLDKWTTIDGLSNQRIGYTLLGWQGGLYRFGGCTSQNASSGDCDVTLDTVDYGVINPAGEVSTVSITEDTGNGDCTGGTPFNCDLPPVGDDAQEGGQLLAMSVILNGYLYVIGGCTDYTCEGTNPGSDDADISGNISYVSIGPNGDMERPSSCPGGSNYGAWCVDTTNRINGTTGIAAGGITTFDNTIYVVGGLEGGSGSDDMSEDIFYMTPSSSNGSPGSWSSVDMTSIGLSSDLAYTYAYARSDPSEASTDPGNLFIFGGCSTVSSGISCNTYSTNVYKCDIDSSKAVSNCSTSGQTQIDSDPDTGGNQGLGIHSGTVYANYIYLIGGYSNTEIDKDEVMIAKFDDNNNVVEQDGSGTSSWSESPNTLSIGRRRGWAFGYNGHIYSTGGYDSTGGGVIPFIEWSKIDVSTGDIDPFITSSVTINQRWGLSMAVSNSYAYVIGGCDVGSSPTGCSSLEPSVQIFQLYNNDSGSINDFTAQSDQTFSTATDRWGASAAVLDGTLYVAGGCTSATDCTTVTDDVQYAAISDDDGSVGTWASLDNLPSARAWGYLGVAGGDLYYVGGEDGSGDEKSDVYYVTPVPGGGGSGGAIEHYSARRESQQSKSTSGWSSVTGSADTGTSASTNGWVDSTNLTAGEDYLVMVWAEHNGSNGGEQSGVRVTHGGSTFTESQGVQINDRTGAAYKTPYFWFTVWTAQSGEDLEVEYYGSGTNTSRVEDVTMVVMNAEELVADGDLQYDIDTAGGTLDSTPTPKASLSWTPGTASDSWWIMGYVQGDTVDTSSDRLEYQLDIDSGTVRSAASVRGDTSATDTPVYGVGWVEPFSAAAHTVDLEISESNANMEWDSAGVFALNLDKFETFAEYSVAGDGPNLVTDDSFVEQGGINPTPSTAGNVLVAGGAIADDDNFRVNNRLQLGGSNITDITGGWQVSSADEMPVTLADMQINHPASAMDIDFDSRFTNGAGPANVSDVWMVAFSMEQTAGAGTWSTASNGLPGDRTRFGAAVWNDRIYVVGGLDDSASETATVYVSPKQDSGGDIASAWSTTTSIDVARQGAAVTAYANNLYVFSGYDGSDYLTDSQFAAIGYKTGTISQSDTTVTGSGTTFTSSMVGDTLNYADGSTAVITSFTSATSIEVNASKTVSAGTTYLIDDGSVGAWSFTTGLTGPLRDARAVSANGYIYLVGGRTASTTCNPKVLVAPISANTTIATGNNPTGIGEWFETNVRYSGDRYGAAVAYESGKIYTMGGGCSSPLSSNRHYYSTVNSQPQVAKYSRMIDTDSDVFPNSWLINGLDNSIGARWQMNYRSMHDLDGIVNPTEDCGDSETMPVMTTWGRDTSYGDITLGDVSPYVAKNSSGSDINCARYFYFFISIDASKTFGYPEDVNRGPTITDLTLYFTADPNKRLRHGKSFTGGEQQPLDTPCKQSVDADCPQP